jgi:hypothetical protein
MYKQIDGHSEELEKLSRVPLYLCTKYIVTCWVVRVTNKMNSRSDDWIY